MNFDPRHTLIFLSFTVLFTTSVMVITEKNLPKKNREGSVLGLTNEVSVSSIIGTCEIILHVESEKRVTPSTNQQNLINVEVYGYPNQNFKGSFSLQLDSLGNGYFNLCDAGITVETGETIELWIKGQSHLNRRYLIENSFLTALSDVNTFTINGILFAGETSVVFNNLINELDLSTQITTFGTNNDINDLNQDGIVNELDISNTITNFKMRGQCSPQNIVNGIEACL